MSCFCPPLNYFHNDQAHYKGLPYHSTLRNNNLLCPQVYIPLQTGLQRRRLHHPEPSTSTRWQPSRNKIVWNMRASKRIWLDLGKMPWFIFPAKQFLKLCITWDDQEDFRLIFMLFCILVTVSYSWITKIPENWIIWKRFLGMRKSKECNSTKYVYLTRYCKSNKEKLNEANRKYCYKIKKQQQKRWDQSTKSLILIISERYWECFCRAKAQSIYFTRYCKSYKTEVEIYY